MIDEVDAALRELLRRDALGPKGIEIAFDPPTRDWGARRSAPTVDIFLYDLREDSRRRSAGEVRERNGAGQVGGIRLPRRWFRLSYLLTAWAGRAEDEHRLLSAVLMSFLRHDVLPSELLGPVLRDGPSPVCSIAGFPGDGRLASEVWPAIGGELRPALDLVVIVAVDPGVRIAPAPPASEGVVVGAAALVPAPPAREERRGPRAQREVAP